MLDVFHLEQGIFNLSLTKSVIKAGGGLSFKNNPFCLSKVLLEFERTDSPVNKSSGKSINRSVKRVLWSI